MFYITFLIVFSFLFLPNNTLNKPLIQANILSNTFWGIRIGLVSDTIHAGRYD